MNLQQLVNKVMSDPNFFEQLKSNPAAALSSQGAKPTPEQIEALKKINYKSLVDVAVAFGGSTGVT
jgi:hypothetical protein